jgi:hypothetical protein
MFECLEVDLNTDQKFLLFNLNNDERKWKYCVRLALTKDLTDRRSIRNFSQSLGHDVRLAFLLHESFFERRRLTSPSNHGGVLRRLKVLSGIFSAATLREKSFHCSQSVFISVDLLGPVPVSQVKVEHSSPVKSC